MNFRCRSFVRNSYVPDLVDGRTARQWLESSKAYVAFLIGDSWRRLSDPGQRHDPNRWHWIEVYKVLSSVSGHQVEQASLHSPSPRESSAELTYRTWRRDELARALVTEDPSLTDYRLLKGLPKLKLARMLAETRRNARRRA